MDEAVGSHAEWDIDPETRAGSGRRRPDAARRPGRTLTLRAVLAAMTCVVLLPMGVLGAVAIREVIHEYQSAYQERMRAAARLLGLGLDAEIQSRKTAIMALADWPLQDRLGGKDMYAYAKNVGDGLGGWVTIQTPTGWVLNTRIPYGSPLPARALTWPDDASAARYLVSNTLHAPDLEKPFVAVEGPVIRDDTVVARIGIPFSHEQLGRRLAEGLISRDGVSCLLDADGVVIARTRKWQQFVGTRVPAWLQAVVAEPDQTVAMGRLLDGGEVIVASAHPSEAPNWTVIIAQPVSGYYREWVGPLIILGGGGLGLLAALLLLVYGFSAWLVRPLTSLTANARLVAQGRDGQPQGIVTSRVTEFEALRLSLGEAAEVMDGRARAITLAFASAQRERNLLHSVVNGSSDPTYVRDARGRFVLANEAGLALLNLPLPSVIGHALAEPGVKLGETARQEDTQVVRTGVPVTIERSILIDGEARTFVGTKSPWRSPHGEVLGVVVILHDITGWKRSEDRLREIQAELIRTGRLSAMGAMANGLAHELNQPLSAITNFLGAARRLIARAADAEGHAAPKYGALEVASGAIEDACAQALRAGEIVSRLRDFIGRGSSSMRMESIRQLVADACALAMPQATRARVVLNVAIDPELEPVFVDRLQVQQVLVNLVLNALQSMAKMERQELTITAGRDAIGDIFIRLSDTGCGIPEPMLDRIFEPFVSMNETGLGMGLAIARMIMAAHGGSLTASNNVSGGATLTLILPAVLSMEAADA